MILEMKMHSKRFAGTHVRETEQERETIVFIRAFIILYYSI